MALVVVGKKSLNDNLQGFGQYYRIEQGWRTIHLQIKYLSLP